VQIGAKRRAVHARVATPEERERLWPNAVATYAGYRAYQQRTNREIPPVILEPRRSPTHPELTARRPRRSRSSRGARVRGHATRIH
jgi:F420H(2)-dependent quinone reductase